MAKEQLRVAELSDADDYQLRSPVGDVNFYVDEARRLGGPVLELGCGTGRVLIPTARAGISIVGLDNDDAALQLARTKLVSEDPEVRVRATVQLGDMRSLDLPQKFQLITLPFRALAYVTAEEQMATLTRARYHLVPSGRVIFDMLQPNPGLLGWAPLKGGLDLERSEGTRVTKRYSRMTPNRADQSFIVNIRWQIQQGPAETEEVETELSLRWASRYEIHHLLARSGFAIESLYGDFQGTPLTDRCNDLVIVARPV